jgi:hypothetical protein
MKYNMKQAILNVLGIPRESRNERYFGLLKVHGALMCGFDN